MIANKPSLTTSSVVGVQTQEAELRFGSHHDLPCTQLLPCAGQNPKSNAPRYTRSSDAHA